MGGSSQTSASLEQRRNAKPSALQTAPVQLWLTKRTGSVISTTVPIVQTQIPAEAHPFGAKVHQHPQRLHQLLRHPRPASQGAFITNTTGRKAAASARTKAERTPARSVAPRSRACGTAVSFATATVSVGRTWGFVQLRGHQRFCPTRNMCSLVRGKRAPKPALPFRTRAATRSQTTSKSTTGSADKLLKQQAIRSGISRSHATATTQCSRAGAEVP